MAACWRSERRAGEPWPRRAPRLSRSSAACKSAARQRSTPPPAPCWKRRTSARSAPAPPTARSTPSRFGSGRAWVRNVERDDRVTCTTVNLENPYEFLEVRGRAELRGREAGERHIHQLSKKYLGLDAYPFSSPDEPRILIAVVPERIVHVEPEAEDLDESADRVE
jgi:hypothetical protein